MTEQHTEWLTRAAAAAVLGVHTRTFDRWVAAGRVPVHRTPGGRPRFRRDELDQLVPSDPPRSSPPASALA